MIINEKGLVRAMKEAYRYGGYKVAGIGMEDNPYLMINNRFWAVEIEMENMPRKALGLLAEHVGKIPAIGEAYQVKKGEVQTVIYATAVSPIHDLDEQAMEDDLPKVCETSLTWNGANIWQRADNMEIVLINPDFEDIVDFSNRPVHMVGDALYVEGEISWAYIMRRKILEGDAANARHLAQMQWAAMK